MPAKPIWVLVAVATIALVVVMTGVGRGCGQPLEDEPKPLPQAAVPAGAYTDTSKSVSGSPGPLGATTERVDGPELVAVSSSAPSLTLEGHLVEFISQQFADGNRPATLGRTKTVDDVTKDRSINPDGKVLIDSARTALAKVLEQYSKRELGLDDRERPLNRACLIEAVKNGRFVAIENTSKASVDSAEGISAMRGERRRQQEELAKTQRLLKEKYGVPLKDWGYSVLSSVGPNGNGFVTTVYFTRAQAPALFQCRSEMSGLNKERQSALKEFFLNQPK